MRGGRNCCFPKFKQGRKWEKRLISYLVKTDFCRSSHSSILEVKAVLRFKKKKAQNAAKALANSVARNVWGFIWCNCRKTLNRNRSRNISVAVEFYREYVHQVLLVKNVLYALLIRWMSSRHRLCHPNFLFKYILARLLRKRSKLVKATIFFLDAPDGDDLWPFYKAAFSYVSWEKGELGTFCVTEAILQSPFARTPHPPSP